MIWELKDPVFGDMIRVKSGSIYHYGIYVSDEEVIQFGLAPVNRPTLSDKEVAVCVSDIDDFLSGGFLEVAVPDKKERKKRRKVAETVNFARGRIGETGYHILYNNCEHFAYECYLGEKYCSQTENVRALFKSLPILDLYIAEIPQDTKLGSLPHKEREKEIESCASEKVKREKYYAWKLLEYAAERTFGKKLKKLTLSKNENGKWECEDFCFSLSHSHSAVAVALSRKSVGVDIEYIAPMKTETANKILTERERAEYEALPKTQRNGFLLEKWTQKESVFKALNAPAFHPARIETENESVRTQTVEIANEEYLLSVASPDLAKLKIVFAELKNL